MYDPTAGQEIILRITTYTPETKQFLTDNPGIVAIPINDPSAPCKSVKKSELVELIAFQVLPTIMEHLQHYKNEDELLYEFGLYNQAVIDTEITPQGKKMGEQLLKRLL